MTSEQFDKLLEQRLESIKKVLGAKAKEYAKGDRLYNFKRAAEILRTTPEKALLGMLAKHLVSVLDLVDGTLECTEHMVNEKIGDTINYLILLEAILKEPEVISEALEAALNPVKKLLENCIQCGECSNSEPEL